MAWQFDSQRPLYLQISERLTYAIVSGQFRAGDRFPAVRELALDAAVNPNTMQKALTEMERQGILTTNRTAGRCVTGDLELIERQRKLLAEASTESYLRNMERLGYSKAEVSALLSEQISEKKVTDCEDS